MQSPDHAPPQPGSVEVVWHPVARLTGGGFAVSGGDGGGGGGDGSGRFGGWVVVDPSLDAPHRRTVIEHERVHLERGMTTHVHDAPASWLAVTAREELLVNREVARRLVPVDGLRTLVARACRSDDAVSVATVAAAFDVTDDLAAVALGMLTDSLR
jgi:hypothetical protein